MAQHTAIEFVFSGGDSLREILSVKNRYLKLLYITEKKINNHLIYGKVAIGGTERFYLKLTLNLAWYLTG